MGYNPQENRFEVLPANEQHIPEHKRDWTRFQEGEVVDLKGITFRLSEVGETRLVLKPLRRSEA